MLPPSSAMKSEFMSSDVIAADALRQPPFKGLSASYPSGLLSEAISAVKRENWRDDDSVQATDEPLLARSCFAQISAARSNINDADNDLCDLAWLSRPNVLMEQLSVCGQQDSLDLKSDSIRLRPDTLRHDMALREMRSLLEQPYNPHQHVHTKPPYSFSCLIFMAIESAPQKQMPVKAIYNWIMTHFPYYQSASLGWKNSVRHNLSLNKSFRRVDKDFAGLGKGSMWQVDPDARSSMLQALKKTPYHPYHQMQMVQQRNDNGLLMFGVSDGLDSSSNVSMNVEVQSNKSGRSSNKHRLEAGMSAGVTADADEYDVMREYHPDLNTFRGSQEVKEKEMAAASAAARLFDKADVDIVSTNTTTRVRQSANTEFNLPSAHLFPFLSRRLGHIVNGTEHEAQQEAVENAAVEALLCMKRKLAGGVGLGSKCFKMSKSSAKKNFNKEEESENEEDTFTEDRDSDGDGEDAFWRESAADFRAFSEDRVFVRPPSDDHTYSVQALADDKSFSPAPQEAEGLQSSVSSSKRVRRSESVDHLATIGCRQRLGCRSQSTESAPAAVTQDSRTPRVSAALRQAAIKQQHQHRRREVEGAQTLVDLAAVRAHSAASILERIVSDSATNLL